MVLMGLDRWSTCCKSPHGSLVKLTIVLASFCDNQSMLSGTLVDTIWHCQVFESGGTRHFVALHCPHPLPYRSTCGINQTMIKLTKMAGTSYSYPRYNELSWGMHSHSSIHLYELKYSKFVFLIMYIKTNHHDYYACIYVIK